MCIKQIIITIAFFEVVLLFVINMLYIFNLNRFRKHIINTQNLHNKYCYADMNK